MNTDEHRLKAVTEKIIGCAFTVSNTLGVGFLEKVYENALVHEMRKSGLRVDQQKAIQVLYDGRTVGEYVADIVVEDLVLVELKVVKTFDEVHIAQCINYLKATKLPLCLLLNFAKPHVDIKRIAL